MKTHLRVLLALAFFAGSAPVWAQPNSVSISGLPAATTPLADTEVAPIVQGGATKKVSAANLKVAYRGTVAPSTPVVGQLWFDTTVTAYVLKQYDGSAWVTLGTLDTVAHTWTPAGIVGGVSSFNTRTGAVTPQSADYSVGQVTGAAPLASPTFTGTVTVPTGGIFNTPASIGLANGTGLVPSSGLNASGTPSSSTFLRGDNSWQTVPAGVVGANPTATIGATAVNGSATTFMRSDAAPALPATLPALSGVNLTALNASNLASGTVADARLALGKSVVDANGVLESVLPPQTVTGASKTFATADLQYETRRSNSGSAMTDTFPASGAAGMINGAKITENNVDATGAITITPGAGTTISGSCNVIEPLRSVAFIYDLASTTWRSTYNTCSGASFASVGSNVVGNLVSMASIYGKVQDSGIVSTSVATGFLNGIIKGNGSGTAGVVTIGSGLTYSGGTLSVTAGGGNANFGTTTGNINNDLVCMANTTVGVKDCGFSGTAIPTSNLATALNAKTGAYTIATTDAGKINYLNNASPFTFTVPTAATLGAAFATDISNIGAGLLSNTLASGNWAATGNPTITTVNGQELFAYVDAGAAGVQSWVSMPPIAAGGFLGNNSGNKDYPFALTATQATAMLNNFTSSLAGLAPASGGGTTNFLRADGTWASAGGLSAIAANSVVANFTGSSAVPIANAVNGGSSCGDSTHAISFTAGTGFGCQAITATGTPGGSNTQLQYNNSGALGGISTFTVDGSGRLTNSASPAASTPVQTLSGAPFTGGSGTTTFPLFYLNSGTAPTTFPTTGTIIGANGPSAFAGDLIGLYTNGTKIFGVNGSTTLVTMGGFDVSSGSSGLANGMQLVSANHPGIYASSTNIVDISSAGGAVWKKQQSDTNAAGYLLATGATSGTVPNLVPNRAASTTGIGAQASGNWSSIVGGVEKFRQTAEGIQYKQATPPAVTGTGSPTINTGATDEGGTATAGASATSVIITFNLSHTNTPACIVTPEAQLASFSYTLSNTAITITQPATSGNKIDYRCTFP